MKCKYYRTQQSLLTVIFMLLLVIIVVPAAVQKKDLSSNNVPSEPSIESKVAQYIRETKGKFAPGSGKYFARRALELALEAQKYITVSYGTSTRTGNLLSYQRHLSVGQGNALL